MTSFSIHCKRMQSPNKQGDDGWKSVLYEGQPLELYRRRYSSKPRRGSASAQDGDEVQWSALPIHDRHIPWPPESSLHNSKQQL